MITGKRFLVACVLALVLSLCLCATALAAAEIPAAGVAPAPETLVAPVDLSNPAQTGSEILLGSALTDTDSIQSGPAGQPGAGEVDSLQPVLGVETVSLSAEEEQMISLVNQERAANGKSPLNPDSSLVKLARLKAQDMVDKRYFDHNSPTYGSPFDMMKKFGISYSYAGENLAMAPSVSSAHKALMESPGHRANILNGNFDRVGIGIVVSGGYRYCVQMFTGGQRDVQQPQVPTDQSAGTLAISADETLMVKLINQERARSGLSQLIPDDQLFKVARLKAQDFVNKGYFGHTSPTYGSFRDMLTSSGIKFVSAGENLAASYTVTSAHNSLMASSGNRANILSAKYQRVGVGIVSKGSYCYFVQIYTDGGTTQPPTGGGTTQPPTGGGTTQPPSGGGTTQPPSGGGTGTTQPPDNGTAGLAADEQKMLSLVNSERAKNGLAALKANLKLTQVARLKARDMIDKNYFDHTSPTYGSPFDMMKQYGISYRTAGENLAGAPTVDSAHTNLMNSPGHRANILKGSFKEVGIGILSGSPYGKIFVQMFIG